MKVFTNKNKTQILQKLYIAFTSKGSLCVFYFAMTQKVVFSLIYSFPHDMSIKKSKALADVLQNIKPMQNRILHVHFLLALYTTYVSTCMHENAQISQKCMHTCDKTFEARRIYLCKNMHVLISKFNSQIQNSLVSKPSSIN